MKVTLVILLACCSKILCIRHYVPSRGLEGHIVGGVTVTIGTYPFVATLITKGRSYCGGSIISDRVILTAAHCLQYPPDELQVGLGATRWANGVKYRICKILPHPDHDGYVADLGLVLLTEKIKFGPTVQKVQIANTGKWRNERYRFEVAGFGLSSDLGIGGTGSRVLKATRMSFVPRDVCTSSYSEFVDMVVPESMFCMVGKDWSSDCFGDSGSGILWKSRWIVGTVTIGRELACGSSNVPSMYTDSVFYRDWIMSNTRRLEREHGVKFCRKKGKAKKRKKLYNFHFRG